MCSTPLSSGLLQSHVSSLSLPSVNAVSNTQVERSGGRGLSFCRKWTLHLVTD